MSKSPFEHIKDVSETKEYFLENEKEYLPFIINRHFSFMSDTIFYAQDMNINNWIDNKLQYDYYFYGLPKKRRYAKWIKKKVHGNIEDIMHYYGFGPSKAKMALSILNDDQLEIIIKRLDKGGLK